MNGMVNDEELLVVAFDIQLRYGFESAWECLMLIVFFLECGHENQEGGHINFQAEHRSISGRTKKSRNNKSSCIALKSKQ